MIADDLDTLDAYELRDALRAARAEATFKQAIIDKLLVPAKDEGRASCDFAAFHLVHLSAC